MKRLTNSGAKFLAALNFLLLAGWVVCAQSWQRLGPEGGMVLSLGADASGTAYLGTSDGHIFASEDRGGSWELRGRAGGRTDGVVAQITAGPRRDGPLFAAVWFREAGAGGGVFRSDDRGRTWQASGLDGEAVRALEFAPSEPRTLVAGTRGGVFESSDEGRSWQRISPVDDPELRNVDSIAVDPADPQVIYAGTYHLPWKTTDGGKTWHSIAAGLIDDSDIMGLRVDAANPARVYLSACSGIYRSEDRGGLWVKLQGVPYSARRTQAILQDPANPATLYAATTEGLWVTRDAGESWERTTAKDLAANAVVVLPGRGDVPASLLLGTGSDGVLQSADAGRSFTVANRGFSHQVVRQLIADSREPRKLLRLLDNNGDGLQESRDAGVTWAALAFAAVPGREGVGAAAETVESVASSPWGWLARSTGGGLWLYNEQFGKWQTWKPHFASLPGRASTRKKAAAAAPRFAIPTGVRLQFSLDAAYIPLAQGIAQCDRAAVCQLLPAFRQVVNGSTLWAAPDGATLAVASEGGFGVSRDAGKTAEWQSLPAGAGKITWIGEAAHRSGEYLLGTEHGLYSGGSPDAPWTRVSGGLPGGDIEQVLQSPELLVVALLDGGIYASRDAGKNWARMDRDGERSRITGLAETKSGEVVFGSQSEGTLIWRSH